VEAVVEKAVEIELNTQGTAYAVGQKGENGLVPQITCTDTECTYIWVY
jgi:hypothetical protein